MRSGPNILLKTWVDVQADWESGLYTVYDLGKKYGIKVRAIVAKQERAAASGKPWQKAKSLDEIVEAMRQKKIRIIAEKRLDEKAYTAIAEALTAEAERIVPSNAVDKDGNKEPGFVTMIPDHTSRMKAVEQLRKLGGLDEAQRKEISGGLRVTTQNESVESLSVEKLKQIREIMLGEGSITTKGDEMPMP